MRSRIFAIVAAALAFAGCGGKVVVDGTPGAGGGGGGPTLAEATCLNYCDVAGKAGCPFGGDCQARCLANFVDACGQEMKSALDCAGPSLQQDCTIRLTLSPTNHACAKALADASQCLTDLAGFTCSGLGDNITCDSDGSCSDERTCGPGLLSMTCDALGSCICVKDGQTVGTCKNLIGSGPLWLVTASCCTPLFAK